MRRNAHKAGFRPRYSLTSVKTASGPVGATGPLAYVRAYGTPPRACSQLVVSVRCRLCRYRGNRAPVHGVVACAALQDIVATLAEQLVRALVAK